MKWHAAALTVLVGCVARATPSGGTVASQSFQQMSLPVAATQARATGGWVAVVRRVSESDSRRAVPVAAGRDDAFLTYDEATFVLEVVDPLGESLAAAEHVHVTARLSPEFVVDALGEPRDDWTVTGAAPIEWQLPPAEGDFVVFTVGLSPESQRVLLVAPVAEGIVSGTHTQEGADVEVSALRRE